MPELAPNQREFIDVSWRNKWDGIMQSQNQVVNWVFAVHGGGIAGLLAFASSKGSSCSVKIGIGAFSFGLILIVVYGVCMFYLEAHHFSKFRKDVDELFTNTIDWTEFSRREEARPDRYTACELLAWGSGICALVGVLTAVVAIL